MGEYPPTLPNKGNLAGCTLLLAYMKKFLLFGGLGLLLVLGVGYVVVAFYLGSIVKAGVNSFGPKLTQTRVELASATLSPFTGTGTLSGLTVGNPAGWSEGRAFYLGTVHLDVEPKSVFKDVIVINELVIDRPEFNYETKFVSSNIGDLLGNIQKYTGSGGATPAAKDGANKKFIVKKLRFTNGKATVIVGVAALPVALPEIKLNDLGVAEGGLTGGQLSAVVMSDVLKTIVAAATQTRGLTGADGLEKTKEVMQQLGAGVKDLFKKKP